MLVRDGHGLVHPLDGGVVPIDGRPHDMSVGLGGIARPVALAGIDLVVPPDLTAAARTYDIDLAYAAAGRSPEVGWRAVPDAIRGGGTAATTDVSTDGSRLTFRAELPPGVVFDDVVLHLRPGAPTAPGPVPVLIDAVSPQRSRSPTEIASPCASPTSRSTPESPGSRPRCPACPRDPTPAGR